MLIRTVLSYLLTLTTLTYAQSIFDDVGSKNPLLQNDYYRLNGFFQGYGQYVNDNSAAFPYYYGAGSIEINSLNTSWSNFYADLRFRYGKNNSDLFSQLEFREAYIDLYFGNLDRRLGKQIVSGGKADGLNPTDNITPMDYTFRSTDGDDRRMGNYVARIKYRFQNDLGVEGIWIPLYKASVLPLEVIPLPDNVTYGGQSRMSNRLENSGYALKLFYDGAGWDGSLSYFNGFETNAGFALGGIDYSNVYLPQITFETRPFRKQVMGGDFSTALGPYGLRTEMAYSHPEEGYQAKPWVANPALDMVLGIDRAFGNLNIIAEYSAKHVLNYQSLKAPGDPRLKINYDLEYYNRLFNRQTDEWSHTVMLRPSLTLFYDIMIAEFVTQYNFTTGELALMPKLTYSVTDQISLNLGANYYTGGGNTLYNMIGSSYNGPYVGINYSF